jgi:hypothetical protein
VNREKENARHPQRDKNGSSAGNVLPFGRTITGDTCSIQLAVFARKALLLRKLSNRQVTIGRKQEYF